MAFDTLAYMKRLEAGGIDRAQAEAHAEAVNDYLRPDLATKDDIATLRGEMDVFRAEAHAGMAGLEQRLVGAISTLRQDIATREARLIGVIAAMLGVLFGLIALLKLLS
jgi:hypothetical protein